jgi:hypothetical protein
MCIFFIAMHSDVLARDLFFRHDLLRGNFSLSVGQSRNDEKILIGWNTNNNNIYGAGIYLESKKTRTYIDFDDVELLDSFWAVNYYADVTLESFYEIDNKSTVIMSLKNILTKSAYVDFMIKRHIFKRTILNIGFDLDIDEMKYILGIDVVRNKLRYLCWLENGSETQSMFVGVEAFYDSFSFLIASNLTANELTIKASYYIPYTKEVIKKDIVIQQKPESIFLNSPIIGQKTNKNKVLIKGMFLKPGKVFVNGEKIKVKAGRFFHKHVLDIIGENVIKVDFVANNGEKETRVIIVYRVTGEMSEGQR